MGSLFSAPPIPTSPSVQYVAPSTSVNPTTIEQKSNESTIDDENDSVKNVIRRTNRGRSSTIQTSYRGALNANSTISPQRKNLLGE